MDIRRQVIPESRACHCKGLTLSGWIPLTALRTYGWMISGLFWGYKEKLFDIDAKCHVSQNCHDKEHRGSIEMFRYLCSAETGKL